MEKLSSQYVDRQTYRPCLSLPGNCTIHFLYSNPARWGRANLSSVFWNGSRTAGRIALKFFIAYWRSFAKLLAVSLHGQLRPWSHEAIIGRHPTEFFQQNLLFSNSKCCHWLRGRGYLWFRPGDDHTLSLTLSPDLSKAIQGHWPWLTPYWPTAIKSPFYAVYWGLRI